MEARFRRMFVIIGSVVMGSAIGFALDSGQSGNEGDLGVLGAIFGMGLALVLVAFVHDP